MNREQARIIIENLVERFAEHRKEYHLPDYNEQKTRQDFINPFFKALGWDIDNEKGASEAYREVIYEDKVIVKGKAKAPDYGFRLAGSASKRLFYVEAKKPSVPLKTNKEAAYQLRRYGSSAQALVSILTNFEDFIIYDCSKVPNLNDSATVARLKHISFEDYIKEFDFIYDTFSHEAVTKGRFDKFIQSGATKKGTDTLDKRFVESLDQWRKYLATSIALNNRKINDEELNFAVQLTIDRLIFLRFCEDRAVEPYGRLQKAVSKGDAYKNLFELFRQADDKYNSGLFDFEKDTITSKLKVDNKVIKYVIEELYYPKCNYEFSVMPVEIIGNAYEQFLGKVIRITPSRAVKIEEKPEVRKAGGVYYTPQYIVEYIVKNTLGKLIEGKSPKDIEKIKIVDPACGSGSFLIGAYHYLLDYHLDYYYNEQKRLSKILENKNIALKEKNQAIKDKGLLPITPDGKLTTKIKKQILVNNIFGVDLDANAVEVTKLSLLLKCMEGETEASIKTITLNLNDRVLPNLDSNIKDGNSLIDTDFYDAEIDLGYEHKIKPFSWKKGFSEVFKQGGFDVVIGNPPYVFTRDVEFGGSVKNYYKANYLNSIEKSSKSRENQTGKANLYSLFIVKGINLLNERGLMGYIIPNTVLRTTIYESVRKYLLDNTSIEKIVDLKAGVFDGVTASTVLLFLGLNKKKKEILIIDNPEKEKTITTTSTIVTKDTFLKNPSYSFSIFSEKEDNILFEKIRKNSINFSEAIDVFNGIATYKNKQGITDTKKNNSCKKLLSGKDIGRYFHNWHGEYIEYNSEKLQRARDENIFLAKEKLIMQRIGGILITSYDNKQYYTFNSVNNLLLKKDSKYSLKFILALLNSHLLRFYYVKNFTNNSRLTVNISKTFLDRLPLVKINFNDSTQKSKHDELVKRVDSLLNLKDELTETKLQSKIDQIQQHIEHNQEKINQMVYELYEIKESDISIIEEACKK